MPVLSLYQENATLKNLKKMSEQVNSLHGILTLKSIFYRFYVGCAILS